MTSTPAALLQRRLFLLATGARLPAAVVVLATAGGAAAAIAQMFAAAQVIVSVFARTGAAGAHLRVLLFLVIARAMLAAVGELAAQRIATRVKSDLRLRVVRHALSLGPVGTPGGHTGEVATTVVEGVEKLDAFYRRFLPQVFATALVPLMVLAAVAWIDPLSAVVLGLTAPLIPLFMWLLGTAAERKARAQWHALSALTGRFLDTVQGLPTLRMFGRDRDAAAAVTAGSEELRRRTMGVLRVAFLSGFVLELAASVSTAIVAAEVGVRLLEGLMTFSAGLTVLLLTPEFYLPFRQLGQRHHAAMEGAAAAERLFDILDTPSAPCSAAGDAGVTVRKRTQPSSSCILRASRLSCRYEGSSAPVLDDVSLALEPGTITAVVGPSGAGKSTLLRVLLRFIEPAAGELTIDGRSSEDVDVSEWRRHIAYVPQRPRFIRGTVLENLRLGNPDASAGEAVAAARLAEAGGFIDALPDGYLTQLDENASCLSGGERQRLALARALLKPAPVLLLDEPTASVDEISEALIAGAIARLRGERTVLMVAHRLNSIRHADRTIVLENGRVREVA